MRIQRGQRKISTLTKSTLDKYKICLSDSHQTVNEYLEMRRDDFNVFKKLSNVFFFQL